MPITLELIPGKGVSGLHIGAKFSECYRVVKELKGMEGLVELRFRKERPLASDISLRLPADGLELVFHSPSQRLQCIVFDEPSKLTLTYKGTVVTGKECPLTGMRAVATFGPTFPGRFDASSASYWLRYPGLAFQFPIPAPFHDRYTESDELPLEFPDGTTPVATSLRLHHPSCDPSTPQLPGGGFEEVHARAHKGIHFPATDLWVCYGASTQEVQSKLGPPERTCYKPNRSSALLASEHLDASHGSDYFYNYFSLGLDILFDGRRHTASKFILHTNVPGHRDFNQYDKCLFVLHCDDNRESQFALEEAAESVVLKADSTWGDAEAVLGPPIGGKPLVHQEDLAVSPFGSSCFYGYPHMILEVMENGCIATATLHA